MAIDAGPYRTSGGMPCPRCAAPMVIVDADLARDCTAGCGTWYPRRALERLIDPLELTRHSRHWWRHEPRLPCPVCGDAGQVVGRDAVTLDSCAEHGLWIAGSRRAAFFAMFADAIKARRGWTPPPDVSVPAHATQTAHERIDELTDRLDRLEQEMASLRAERTGWVRDDKP